MDYQKIVDEICEKMKQAESLPLPVKATFYGIKCDNMECHWEDMSVPFSKYPEYVDKACPCCGDNLLTKENMEKCIEMLNFILEISDIANSILPKVDIDKKAGFKATWEEIKDKKINSQELNPQEYQELLEEIDDYL